MEGKLDVGDKPPSRVQPMADSYYPVVCHPVPPVNAYRVLFWFRQEQERVCLSRHPNHLDND